MKIREPWLLMAVAFVVVAVAFLQDTAVQVSAQGTGDLITRQRWSVVQEPAKVFRQADPTGNMVDAANFAAYPWHPVTEAPTRPDGGINPVDGKPIPGWPTNPTTGKPIVKWPIVAEFAGTPSVVWYWGKSFRTSSGSNWGKPTRWAYVRLAEEVWNPATKQFDVPGLAGAPAPVLPPATAGKAGVHIDDVAGQQLMDIMKRSFTDDRLKDFMDLSPYNEPDTGSPEDGPGALGVAMP